MRIKIILLALSLLLISGLNAQAAVENDKAAPDFTLTDTNGKNHSLSDYKGKFVVLEWFNPDCPFVKKHYESGNIPNLQKKYTGQGVIWLTIDSSASGKEGSYPSKDINDWVNKNNGAATAVLLDSEGKVGKMYGAKTTPHMFVIDSKGNLVYQGAIDSIPSAEKSDLAAAKNYVQMALDESMAGKPVSTPSTKSYGCSIKY